jgi:hypothetical protein
MSGDATLGAWQAWLTDPLRILIEIAWLAYIPLFAVVILCANEGGALRMFTNKRYECLTLNVSAHETASERESSGER